MMAHKSTLERSLQAVGFEVLALVIFTPLAAWLMATSLTSMGGLALVNCLVALAWNVLFNAGFDRALRSLGWEKTARVRVGHAILFEGGLVLFCMPLAMVWLGLDFWAALKLDICMNLFFLPYTYLYHWLYDLCRQRLVGQA